MQGLSNGVGTLLITQLDKLDIEKLKRIRTLLQRFLVELRKYASNLTRFTRDSVDDLIANSASSQILDIYISNAIDFIGFLNNAIKNYNILQFENYQRSNNL